MSAGDGCDVGIPPSHYGSRALGLTPIPAAVPRPQAKPARSQRRRRPRYGPGGRTRRCPMSLIFSFFDRMLQVVERQPGRRAQRNARQLHCEAGPRYAWQKRLLRHLGNHRAARSKTGQFSRSTVAGRSIAQPSCPRTPICHRVTPATSSLACNAARKHGFEERNGWISSRTTCTVLWSRRSDHTWRPAWPYRCSACDSASVAEARSPNSGASRCSGVS